MDSLNKLMNTDVMNTSVYALLWVITILYIVYQAHLQRWDAVISLVGVFIIFYLVKKQFNLDIAFILTVSILISYIATFQITNKKVEGFDNPENEPSDAKDPEKEDDEVKEKDSKQVLERKEDDDLGDNNVDIGKTFLEAYKSLTPDQIESMTSDTKELLATQQNLMNTIKSLAPVVIQGKEMLSNFKEYFGTDGLKDTMGSLKDTGNLLNQMAPLLKELK